MMPPEGIRIEPSKLGGEAGMLGAIARAEQENCRLAGLDLSAQPAPSGIGMDYTYSDILEDDRSLTAQPVARRSPS